MTSISWQSLFVLVCAWTAVTHGFVASKKVQGQENEHVIRSKRAPHCFGELGCYDPMDYWHAVDRPISLPPSSRDTINTRFGLYTRKNRPTEQPRPQFIRANDKESVDKSLFNPKLPIKFLVHGFLDTGFLKWVNELGNALLEIEDLNIIAVDWSGGNGVPYSLATANTWVVGGEIWLLSKFLIEQYGVSLDNIHIIGHSLGAHVAGYTGQRFNGSLGRISALDAAEPFFQYLPEYVRLDPGDAKFVDAIHTDAKTILLLGFGMIQPVGHLDFYPNKGMEQPGCDMGDIIGSIFDDGFQDGVRKFVACNHQRAIDIYTDSIKSTCPFVGHECHDYEYYLNGRCVSCGEDGTKCAKMGYHSIDHPDPTGVINRKLYLTTSDKLPFCVYHYVVTVVMQENPAQEEEEGTMKVTLYGTENHKYSAKLTEENMKIRRGRRYEFLISNPISLGAVKRIDFSWTNKWKPFHFDPKLYIENIEVEPLDITQEKTRVAETTVNCMKSKDSIKPKNTYTFYADETCKV